MSTGMAELFSPEHGFGHSTGNSWASGPSCMSNRTRTHNAIKLSMFTEWESAARVELSRTEKMYLAATRPLEKCRERERRSMKIVNGPLRPRGAKSMNNNNTFPEKYHRAARN